MSGRRKRTKRGGARAGWGILVTMLQTGLFIGAVMLAIYGYIARWLVFTKAGATVLAAACLGFIIAVLLRPVESVKLLFWQVRNPLYCPKDAGVLELKGRPKAQQKQSDDTIKGLESKLKATEEDLKLAEHVLAACSHRQTLVDYLVRAVGTEDFDNRYRMYVDALAYQAGNLARRQDRNPRTTIMEYDAKSGQFTRLGQVPPGPVVMFEPNGGRGVAVHVATTGEPAIIGDVLKDPRYKQVGPEAARGSLLVVPVYFSGEVVGVINVSHGGNDGFGEDDAHRMRSLADWLAVGIALEPISRELVNLRRDSDASREN